MRSEVAKVEREACGAFGFGQRYEAERRVQVAHHIVFFGGAVLADEADRAALLGTGGEEVEARLLDAATENATAHEEGFDDGIGAFDARHEDGDEAVVAEAVGE